MYDNMQQWMEIRRRVLVEGVSKRQILRETGMHWRTLEKMLDHSKPPGYRRSKPRQTGARHVNGAHLGAELGPTWVRS